MKHIWTIRRNKAIVDLKIIQRPVIEECARCGMDKDEWEVIGKPPCKEKIPVPEKSNYIYG